MTDEIHKLFNEAHEAALKLSEELKDKGYNNYSAYTSKAASLIDAAHHDYTELILDPS